MHRWDGAVIKCRCFSFDLKALQYRSLLALKPEFNKRGTRLANPIINILQV